MSETLLLAPVRRTRTVGIVGIVGIVATIASASVLNACQRGPAEPPAGSRPAVAPTTPAANTGAPLDPHAGLGIAPPSGNSAPPLRMPGDNAGANPSTAPAMPGTPTGNTAQNTAENAPPPPDLVWDDPPGWRREQPSSGLRRAQYKVNRVGADTQDAEMTVITFGIGQGGGIEANVQRWLGQIEQPDGRQTSDLAQRRSLTTHGMSVTIVEAPGRIRMSNPMSPPGTVPTVFERGRLLAAIIEAPSGMWFFKLMGGDQTVQSVRGAFDNMLRSVH